MYNSNNLLQLVDPALDQNFDEEEATRYLKIGLHCEQERAKNLRPQMSMAVKMLSNEISLAEMKNYKAWASGKYTGHNVGKKTDSHTFSSSKAPTSSTSLSNRSTYL